MFRESMIAAVLLVVPVAAQVTGVRVASAKLPAPEPARPNLVLIIADDFGVDLMGAYGEGSAPPCTPHIDGLAQEGLLFRNAWANPSCSPTRAALLTGRHGFRTGIGTPGGVQLSFDETTLPELLGSVGYTSAAVGKWHLGNGALHPNLTGFDRFAGSLGGVVASYTSWNKTVDGVTSPTTTYATTDTTDEAIAAALTLPEPFFLYVAYNAPHTPIHVPDDALCPDGPCALSWCDAVGPGPGSTPAQRVKAMVEAMDTEIGRLLEVLDDVDPDAHVVFIGDNGTTSQASEPPFLGAQAKGTVYEGGVNVPFVVRGPGVASGESAALVSTVDLHATFAGLAGVASTGDDSVSLVPLLHAPRGAVRETVYAETFSPNGSGPWTTHLRAVRDERYKLIRRIGAPDEFYDLVASPFETVDLLPGGLDPAQQAAYDALVAELVALGVD